MELTPENKAYIDGMTYMQLLKHWRFAPVGDPWFEGETGKYWDKRMEKLIEDGEDPTAPSKSLGWILK